MKTLEISTLEDDDSSEETSSSDSSDSSDSDSDSDEDEEDEEPGVLGYYRRELSPVRYLVGKCRDECGGVVVAGIVCC